MSANPIVCGYHKSVTEKWNRLLNNIELLAINVFVTAIGCRVVQKNYATAKLSINHVKYLKPASEIIFFRQCKTSTMILSFGIKYSMRDLICNVTHLCLS